MLILSHLRLPVKESILQRFINTNICNAFIFQSELNGVGLPTTLYWYKEFKKNKSELKKLYPASFEDSINLILADKNLPEKRKMLHKKQDYLNLKYCLICLALELGIIGSFINTYFKKPIPN